MDKSPQQPAMNPAQQMWTPEMLEHLQRVKEARPQHQATIVGHGPSRIKKSVRQKRRKNAKAARRKNRA